MGKRRAKGSGYLLTNPDGSLTLIKSVKDPYTRKIKKIQVSGPTEAACIKRMNKKLSESKDNLLCVDTSSTVSQLCRKHLEMQYREDLIKRTSRDRNDVTIRNQIENSPLGHMQLQSAFCGLRRSVVRCPAVAVRLWNGRPAVITGRSFHIFTYLPSDLSSQCNAL